MVRHQFLRVGLWCSPPLTCSHSGCEEQEGALTVAWCSGWLVPHHSIAPETYWISTTSCFHLLGSSKGQNLRGCLGDPLWDAEQYVPVSPISAAQPKRPKAEEKRLSINLQIALLACVSYFFFPGEKRGSVGEYRSQLRLQHTRRWLVAGTAPPGGAPAATSSPAGRTALPGPALAGAAAGPDGTGRDGTGLLKGRAGPGGPRRCREAEPPRPAPASPPAPRPPPRRSGRAAPQLGAGPG